MTYDYRTITETAERFIRAEMAAADEQADDKVMRRHHRSVAVGAWDLWRELTQNEKLTETQEDRKRLGALIGLGSKP